MIFLTPICFDCQHFDENTSTCKAFPSQIPIEILNGDNDHTEPLPTQGNNIVFEPKKNKPI